MRPLNRAALLTAMVAVVAGICPVAAAQQSGGWYADYAEAERVAREEGRPLLLHFHAWYCGPCKQMDAQVFSQPDVQRALRQNLVAVDIEVTRETDVASRYNVSTVPCDVVVFPDGSVEVLQTGFVPRATYLAMLQSVQARGERMRRHASGKNAGTPAEPGNVATRPDTGAGQPGAVSQPPGSSDALEPLLGLEGYCPVRLMLKREWIVGRPELTESWRGVQYRFASPDDRNEFLKDPGRYAPQNLGCDPVVLYTAQRAITGKIQFGAFFDNQLFLFNSDDNKAEFKKNPLKFTRIRHAIRRESIEGSRFQ